MIDDTNGYTRRSIRQQYQEDVAGLIAFDEVCGRCT
jgi:hypothetical protein